MRTIVGLSIPVIFLFSCTPPDIQVTRSYSNIENFHIVTGNADVEFVKDSSEYVLYIGHAASDPTTIFTAEEVDFYNGFDTLKYLDIKGGTHPNNIILDKIEVHYNHLHRVDFATDQPGTHLGVYLDRAVYTREPIVEDSIQLMLRDKHRSFMEVNTSYLQVNGGNVTEIQIKGTAQHFEANFSVSQEHNLTSEINFSELQTDSCFLALGSINSTGGYTPYARIEVNASNYLEIQMAGQIGSCSSCICEIYYKGHPTIVNYNSSDARIVVIDDN